MRKLKKLKGKYPITGFVEIDEQLIKDQIDSRKSSIEFLKKKKNDIYGNQTNKEVIKFHKSAIEELKEMQKEINN